MTVETALFLVLQAIGLTLGDIQLKIEGYGSATGFPERIGLVKLKEKKLKAECILGRPDDLYVLAGTDDLSKGGTWHSVKEIHVHENYDKDDSLHNDIAVMKVDPPFVFGNSISPVTLASSGQITAPGTAATVVGWGRLSEEESPPNELKKMYLSVTEHTVCEEAYIGTKTRIHKEHMCAEVPEGKKGPCNGDSGGPLLVDGKVVGIVSWSKGCAEKGYPTVFTEVSHYIEWIESKLGYHNRYSELPPRHRIEL